MTHQLSLFSVFEINSTISLLESNQTKILESFSFIVDGSELLWISAAGLVKLIQLMRRLVYQLADWKNCLSCMKPARIVYPFRNLLTMRQSGKQLVLSFAKLTCFYCYMTVSLNDFIIPEWPESRSKFSLSFTYFNETLPVTKKSCKSKMLFL